MCCSYMASCLLVLLCGLADGGEVGMGDSTDSPTVVDQIPGREGKMVSHFDGSAVCRTDAGVFVSDGDALDWLALPDPTYGNVHKILGRDPLGGDRTRFFASGDISCFGEPMAKSGVFSQAIAAINVGGKLDVVWRGTPGIFYHAAFATKDIGAVAWSIEVNGTDGALTGVANHFLLTLDGGKTWKETAIPDFEAKFHEPQNIGSNQAVKARVFEGIANLLWVDSSRLLVASEKGSLQLVECKENGTLHRVWAANAGGAGKDLFVDGDHVWAGQGPLTRRQIENWQPGKCSISRLKLANGEVDGAITADARDRESGENDGAMACHQYFLTWGLDRQPISPCAPNAGSTLEEARLKSVLSEKHIDVWANDPKQGYIRRARIVAPSITGVLPLKIPLCLVITRDGKGLQLDLEKCKLSPVVLHVTLLPPTSSHPSRLAIANAKMLEWFEKAPDDGKRTQILNSVFSRTDLTPAEQVEMATKQLREYIDLNNAHKERHPRRDSANETIKPLSGE